MKMNLIVFSPILLIIIWLIIHVSIKGKNGLKLLIMGIQFTLFGIGLLLLHDSISNSLGLSSMFLGLIVSLIGLIKKD